MGYEPIPVAEDYQPYGKEEGEIQWDLSPLQELDEPVSICYGTEWYRFPGSYLIPEGVEVNFIKTEFDGMMPRKWEESERKGRWPRSETRVIRAGRFNGENKASLEPGTFVSPPRIDFQKNCCMLIVWHQKVDPSECTYMVSLSLLSQTPTELEPDWTRSPEWEKEFCTTFLDGASSKWWSRLIYLPWGLLDSGRVYGEYCLMHRKGAVHGA